jgi:hypothetical protein
MDENALRSAIDSVESSYQFSSWQQLARAVRDEYNLMGIEPKITHWVVLSRIEDMGIEVKTKKNAKGRHKDET